MKTFKLNIYKQFIAANLNKKLKLYESKHNTYQITYQLKTNLNMLAERS